jgi:hypothetical protein
VRRSREHRIIAAALRCYPARWRTRHGDEAVVLASALLEDGTPWWSIAGSYLASATKERAFRKPSLRIGSVVTAIILGITVTPLALFASFTPASASSNTVTIVISKPGDAARQLESAFATHHFKIAVVEVPVPAGVVGSILAIRTPSASGDNAGTIGEVRGQCISGDPGCVVGLVVPLHFSGNARVTVGVATTLRAIHQSHLAHESRIP